ncbi:MAG TPA: hypothetical protein VGH43_09255, partial [Jatrophihabitans sp.]
MCRSLEVRLRSTRFEGFVGAAATLVVLTVVSFAVGLGPAGWTVGVLAGLGAVALHIIARRHTSAPIGPADWVTLTRAVLVAGVAGLVARGGDGATIAWLVALSSIAL